MNEWNEKCGGVLTELSDRLKKLTPVQRAELVIKNYCEVMNTDPELDRRFRQWLKDNALHVLQTESLEMLFDKMTEIEISAEKDTAKGKAADGRKNK